MIAALWSRLAPYVLAVVAVGLILAAAYGRGKKTAETAARLKELETAGRAAKARRNVEERNRHPGGASATERLRDKWQRD